MPAWPTCDANLTIAAPVTWFTRFNRLGAHSVWRTTTSCTRNHYMNRRVSHWSCICQYRKQSDEDQSNSSLEERRHDEWQLVTCSNRRPWLGGNIGTIFEDLCKWSKQCMFYSTGPYRCLQALSALLRLRLSRKCIFKKQWIQDSNYARLYSSRVQSIGASYLPRQTFATNAHNLDSQIYFGLNYLGVILSSINIASSWRFNFFPYIILEIRFYSWMESWIERNLE